MARTLTGLPEPPPLPDGITLRQVTEEQDAHAFRDFAAWRWRVPEKHRSELGAILANMHFGQPGSKFHMWQAWRGDMAVAKAGLYLSEGSAGIYGVATRPEARRLGLAQVLTVTALAEAHRQGLNLAVLHSSPMAERLYRRLRFEAVAPFSLFSTSAEAPV
jgi:GNAT superfamily N-acetyltransferase